jgi:hypothetical protein
MGEGAMNTLETVKTLQLKREVSNLRKELEAANEILKSQIRIVSDMINEVNSTSCKSEWHIR